MRKLHLFLALATLCLCVGACDDDDPVKPAGFAVTIQVNDIAGDPVEGLRVYLVNDHAFFQDGGMAAKASVRIPFFTEVPVHFVLTIEDIEGRTIRNLHEGDIQKGSYRFIWDGKNNADVYQPSGRYTAHLVCTNQETGYWVFEDRTDMLLSMLDSSTVPEAFTDRNLKLVLKDKTLFPHLYDRPDLTATDENSQMMGLFNLTSMMRISLSDTSGGGGMWYKMVVDDSEPVNLTWDPALAAAAMGDELPAPLFPGVAKTDTTHPELFNLGLAYPNPFN